MVYRTCIVPKCKSTTIATPGKTFISVPGEQKIRKLWLNAVRRNPNEYSKTSSLFVCEDHFDLEYDMENYREWTIMKCRKRMKKNIVPHKFECEENRKRTIPQAEIEAVLKKRRQELVAEYLDHQPSTSSAVQDEEQESVSTVWVRPFKKDIGVQVHIKPYFRSKAIQCVVQTPIVSQSCSPMSIKKKMWL